MSIFTLIVDDHRDQFGGSIASEGLVLAAILSRCAQSLGSGVVIGTEDAPSPVVVNGIEVGKFFVGPYSHRFAHQAAAKQAAAEGDAHRAKAG
jgi:hypothetical protein